VEFHNIVNTSHKDVIWTAFFPLLNLYYVWWWIIQSEPCSVWVNTQLCLDWSYKVVLIISEKVLFPSSCGTVYLYELRDSDPLILLTKPTYIYWTLRQVPYLLNASIANILLPSKMAKIFTESLQTRTGSHDWPLGLRCEKPLTTMRSILFNAKYKNK
jgi:hypothetical protein